MEKNLKILSVAIALLISPFMPMASTRQKQENKNTIDYSLLKKQIRKQIAFPYFLKDNKLNEYVKVVFKVSEKGMLNVVSIKSNSRVLKEYVSSCLEYAKVNCDFLKEEIYMVDIHFKVL